MEHILRQDGSARLYPQYFSPEASDHYFRILLEGTAWKQEPVLLFGKKIMQPRLTAWYGDPGKAYRYSGLSMLPETWTPALLEIRQRIETVSPATFNSALLNLYRDQQDSIGWHRDNEKSLGVDPVIASVSFGATRLFRFRHYKDRSRQVSVALGNGSLLIMQGSTQQHWEHSLPKQRAASGPRINITFRNIRQPDNNSC
jgi:alkylated DNA repair dioxygenase AlkB